MKRLFFPLIAAFLLTSCFTIKPGATKTGKKLWEEFYVSEGVIQYFIKPLTYRSTTGEFAADFTFRTNSDSATINFSIIQPNPVPIPESIAFSNYGGRFVIKSAKTLLNEKFKKGYKLRQSGKISLLDFKRMIDENTFIATVKNESGTNIYNPSKTTIKQHTSLKNNLFEIIFPNDSKQ